MKSRLSIRASLGALLAITSLLDVFSSQWANAMDIPAVEVIDQRALPLLREAVIAWEITEAGAPTIDPRMPYGSTKMVRDIQRIAGVESRSAALALHAATVDALGPFLRQAVLKPGVYTYRNPLSGIEGDLFVDAVANFMPELASGKDVRFEITQTHLDLLRAASWGVRWNAWDEDLDEDYYPVAALDAKRPYGDMTYYFIDMATILGMAFDSPEQLEDHRDRFVRLHREMQPALQVFLKHAQLPADRAVD